MAFNPVQLPEAPGAPDKALIEVPARAVRRRRRRMPLRVKIAIAFLAVVVLGAILGPFVRPYSAVDTNLSDRLLAPGAHLANGSISLLGTDQLGRDMLAEVLAGSRVSVIVGVLTVLIGGLVGLVLGLLAGYFGGGADTLISRLGDIQLAFPSVLLAILIAGVLGPSLTNIIIALAVTRWVIFARVVRASAISVRGLDYVDSARILGAGNVRILVRYILPSCWASLLVAGTAQIGLAMVAEASLSFLGLGVPVTQASWGSTISNGRDYLSSAWWISALPGIMLALVVVCIGLVSDAYRDFTDPRAAL